MKKIVLVGTYCGLNKGDRIMQQVFADNMQDIGECCLLSPFPMIDENLYRNLEIKKAYRRNLILSLFKTFILLMPDLIRKKFVNSDSELKTLNQSDLIVDLSGDMLTEDYGVHVGLSHAFPLIFSFLLRKKYVIAPQSIGKFRYLRWLYIPLLKNAEVVFCREKITFDYLSALGLTNIEKAADLGFLLSKNKPEKIDLPDKYFCISPSSLLISKFNKGVTPSKVLSKVTHLLDEISTKYNLKVVLVPHVMTPKSGIDDADVCHKLNDLLSVESIVLPEDFSPEEVKFVISKSQFTIGFRMHAVIAALSSSVPAVAVAYSHKAYGIMNECGLGEFVIEYDDDFSTNILACINRIVDNRDHISSILTENVEEVSNLAEKNVLQMREIVHA